MWSVLEIEKKELRNFNKKEFESKSLLGLSNIGLGEVCYEHPSHLLNKVSTQQGKGHLNIPTGWGAP